MAETTSDPTPADAIAELEATVADLRATVEAATAFFARVAKVREDLATIKSALKSLIPGK